MDNCIFCGIVSGKVPSYKVFEDEHFIATLDINPANAGHMILIPKKHYKTIMEMPDFEYSRMWIVARVLSLSLMEFGAQGINFLYSMGDKAGQRAPHLILHIIPRMEGDQVNLVWQPKKFSEDELEKIKQRLSEIVPSKPQSVQQQSTQQAPQPTPQPSQQQAPQPTPQPSQQKQPQEPEKEPPKEDPRVGGYW